MILVSKCLAGYHCCWDGSTNLVSEIKALVDQGLAVTACPEVLGGLPTPREPSEIQAASIVNKAGLNVTKQFKAGAEKALAIFLENNCTCAILKAKSPSCGKGTVHNGLFDGGLVTGNGITAQLFLDHGIEVFTEHEWLKKCKLNSATYD